MKETETKKKKKIDCRINRIMYLFQSRGPCMVCVSASIHRFFSRLLTYNDVCDDKGEYEDGEEGEGENEHVEETVVPSSHAVSHPRTVMVKTLCEGERRIETEG